MKQELSCASRPVMLNTGTQLVRFDLSQLAYLEADRVYCNLFMADGVTRYQVCHPLGHVEKQLPADMFVRISRSFVVNIWHVARKMGNTLYLEGYAKPLYMTDSYRHALDNSFLILSLTGQK